MNHKNNLTLRKLEMTSDDLKGLLDLQNKIIEGLHPDEQHFILHRTVDDFSKALKSDYMYVFGLFDGDRMVAQSILSLPGNDVEREIAEFGQEYQNSDIAVFKAVLVDPEYRGKGLMKKMLNIRECVAVEHGRKLAITQIAADNPASWINAIQYGMKITKVGLDPNDQAEVVYLQKSLNGEPELPLNHGKIYDLHLGQNVHKNVPMLFNKMVRLSETGMVGISWDKKKNAIRFVERESFSNTKALKKVQEFSSVYDKGQRDV